MDVLQTWLCLLVCLCVSIQAEAAGIGDLEAAVLQHLIMLRQQNATIDSDWERAYISTPRKRANIFHCPVLAPSPTTPTSVHRLRPGDISVVAGLGDSLTAGRGVELGVLGLLIDFYHFSWSAGGDGSYEEFISVPNILRNYNPDLYGYSQRGGKSKARFNVAVSGANSVDMLGQAERLVHLMRADSKVDFANSWKLITLFIGANDLCDYCKDENAYSAESYFNNVKLALDYLHENVPRAFVNLVEVLPVEFVRQLGDNVLCKTVQAAVCNCIANPSSAAEAQRAVRLRQDYQKAAQNLVQSNRYETRDDFTVVLQPFYRNSTLPTTSDGEVDLSYFASDCFHYSKRGQQSVAEALWDNMVQPVGCKQTSWKHGYPITCPTEENPYLYTVKNSNTTRTN